METLGGKQYQSLRAIQFLEEIIYDSVSEMREISDYKADFDHDDSDTGNA